MATTVVNLRFDLYDIYIGRTRSNEHFGNPFSHLRRANALIHVPNRDAAIDQFGFWLYGKSHQDVEPERRAWILSVLYQLKNLRLGCYCAPRRCHGDVYVGLLETQFERLKVNGRDHRIIPSALYTGIQAYAQDREAEPRLHDHGEN